jgi:hypothetical protein
MTVSGERMAVSRMTAEKLGCSAVFLLTAYRVYHGAEARNRKSQGEDS